MDHLDAWTCFAKAIGLRSYGQRNPIVEYKFEAYDMFEEMKQSILENIVLYLYHIQIHYAEEPETPKTEDPPPGSHGPLCR